MSSPSPSAISIENAEHYVWGDVCDGWHLLRSAGLSVIRERVPPAAGEVKHYHKQAHQFFFVLSGRACMELEGNSIHLGAGEGVHVPAGLPHRFTNPGTEDVHFLVISSPPTAGDRTNLA